jgi:hypothetical protein
LMSLPYIPTIPALQGHGKSDINHGDAKM